MPSIEVWEAKDIQTQTPSSMITVTASGMEVRKKLDKKSASNEFNLCVYV